MLHNGVIVLVLVLFDYEICLNVPGMVSQKLNYCTMIPSVLTVITTVVVYAIWITDVGMARLSEFPEYTFISLVLLEVFVWYYYEYCLRKERISQA